MGDKEKLFPNSRPSPAVPTSSYHWLKGPCPRSRPLLVVQPPAVRNAGNLAMWPLLQFHRLPSSSKPSLPV